MDVPPATQMVNAHPAEMASTKRATLAKVNYDVHFTDVFQYQCQCYI